MQLKVIWEGDTAHGHYQVVDCLYDGRPARVLYSGDRQAAQSGVASDDKPELLFDYNQRFLELAEARQPANVAIIGGGAGTLATALLSTLPDVRIDMVEPDPDLTDLGYRFFGLPVDVRLQVFHTDGRTFLDTQADRYDLIVVDAFNHTVMPTELATADATQAYRAHLRPNGLLAMNIISGYHGSSAERLARLSDELQTVFARVEIFLARRGYSLWLPQNFVVVARSNDDGLEPGEYLRTDIVAPPA